MTAPQTPAAGADAAPDLSAASLDSIRLAGLDPRARIAPHFSVRELLKSDVASRQGIINAFESERHLVAAVHLARAVLEPVRAKFGPFAPNSVYRGQALERALKKKASGWFSTSQHARGEACDIEIPGVTTLALAEWAAANLPFDQIICECYDPREGPNSGWVHISLRAPGAGTNRGALLSYVRASDGKMAYVSGLVAQRA